MSPKALVIRTKSAISRQSATSEKLAEQQKRLDELRQVLRVKEGQSKRMSKEADKHEFLVENQDILEHILIE